MAGLQFSGEFRQGLLRGRLSSPFCSMWLWSRFFGELLFFFSHCWWRYLNSIFVFSVTIICSDGISLVGKYIDGLFEQFLIPWSVLNNVKLCSSYDGRSFRNSITDIVILQWYGQSSLFNNQQFDKSNNKAKIIKNKILNDRFHQQPDENDS